MKFSRWIELKEERSSRTKSGKKVPGKYLAGLSEKGKHGSKQAMKKEIEQFRGKDNYKLDWDADYKRGKRIKTKKGKATKAFERMFGKNENFNINEAAIGPKNIQYSESGFPAFRVKILEGGKELQLELLRGQGQPGVPSNINYKYAGDLGSEYSDILKGYKLYNWHSDLPRGYGPLFYDIALEIVTKNDGYLASTTLLNALKNYDPVKRKQDKGLSYGGDTSDAAENIYKFYYYKRNDVEKIQPNIILGNEQDQTLKPYMYELYRKSPTVLNQLIQMNKNGKQPVLVNESGEAIVDLNFSVQKQSKQQFAGFESGDKRTWQQRSEFLKSQGIDTSGWGRAQIMRGSNT